MAEETDAITEVATMRRLVAVLWTRNRGTTSLSPADETKAQECAAWVLSEGNPSSEDVYDRVQQVSDTGEWTPEETWQLVAYTMERSRDRAIRLRDALTDVAAGAVAFLRVAEEAGIDDTSEAVMLKRALYHYEKVRNGL